MNIKNQIVIEFTLDDINDMIKLKLLELNLGGQCTNIVIDHTVGIDTLHPSSVFDPYEFKGSTVKITFGDSNDQ